MKTFCYFPRNVKACRLRKQEIYIGDELFVVLNATGVPIYVIMQRKEKQWTAGA
jgi:hypothetical protein